MPIFPVPRAELKEGDCLCNHCTALCCRYFSLPIDSPASWDDFDDLQRILTFGRTTLFVEEDQWYLVVQGDCQYLTPDYRCGIYTERPLICGQYTTDGCEYDSDVLFDKYFETPDQVREYAEAVLPPRQRLKTSRKPRIQYVLPHGTAGGRDHFILKIDAPTDWDDYDNFRWYMTHGPVSLLVANDAWHLVVFRTQNGTTLETRGTKDGRKVSVEIERYFESPDQIWEYAAAILPEREPLERDKPQKLTLPVLNETH